MTNDDGIKVSAKTLKHATLNSMIWTDLKALSKIKPFNKTNLLDHIKGNANMWRDFIARKEPYLGFESFPNGPNIDFEAMMNEGIEGEELTILSKRSTKGDKTVGKAPS